MYSYLMSPIVTVAVGRDEAQRTFFLHKDILKHSSEFFKSGLHDYFQSGQTKTFDLPEDDPTIFALFAKYIYSNKYEVDSLGEGVERDMDAYILGQKYLAPEFSQSVFRQLEKCFNSGRANADKALSVDKILKYAQKIYDGTSPGDPLRQLVAKLAASMSGQPLEPANPSKQKLRSRYAQYGISSSSDSELSGSDSEPAAKGVERKRLFSAKERMKLVKEGGEEFLCDVLGHCVAPHMSDLTCAQCTEMSWH